MLLCGLLRCCTCCHTSLFSCLARLATFEVMRCYLATLICFFTFTFTPCLLLVACTLFVSLVILSPCLQATLVCYLVVRTLLLTLFLLLTPCYSQGHIGCSHLASPYHYTCCCPTIAPCYHLAITPCSFLFQVPPSPLAPPPNCCFIALLLYCCTLLQSIVSWYSLFTLLCKWKSLEQHQQASSSKGFFFPNP